MKFFSSCHLFPEAFCSSETEYFLGSFELEMYHAICQRTGMGTTKNKSDGWKIITPPAMF